MTDYNLDTSFDRILLFKPQKNMKYIRKLSMSYGYYVALAVVDKNDRVTHIGVENNFQIVLYRNLTSEDCQMLGPQKCSKLEDDDLMSVYSINNAIKLHNPYRLNTPCRGMRYTTPEETYYLKKDIISSSYYQLEKDKEETDNVYNNIYSEDIVLNVDDVSLDELLDLDLEVFNSINATGQTKLI
jgi:hypothetical protein